MRVLYKTLATAGQGSGWAERKLGVCYTTSLHSLGLKNKAIVHAWVETLHTATKDPQIPIFCIRKTFMLPFCKRANQETDIACIALYK